MKTFKLNTETRLYEEHGAVIPHAGICAGASPVIGCPTATCILTKGAISTEELAAIGHSCHQCK